jgi:hypothetical protein
VGRSWRNWDLGKEWRRLGTMTYHGGEDFGARRGRVRCGPFIDAEKLGVQGSREVDSAMRCSDSATMATQP